MNIRNKIENSKTLLFTSLVAVALLGATQPVSAETYTSRNFDWSGDDWSGDDWSSDKKDETEDKTRPPYG
ncbi:TPA: lysis inhibitor protein, partial [Streptococcus pyogenes]|nr:lysis inhibitor protein [Streptococcus pyogenes ABC020041159]HER0177370.1 lysis inhibitor protein [Streptococcus pyogenes]HER0208612.1 lysis inhibitor protein [Streptococcus pyogenes]HER0239215.1 lysis inhibitor protein [Streptococcus pyogenes]HER0273165.1 lysis inhibitor protein [Streptococcus pyogenes]